MKVINRFMMLAAILMAVSSCESKKEETEPLKSVSFTVMSFNIRSSTQSDTGDRNWSARKTAVKAMVEDIKPDVIGMQEATTQQRTDLKALLPGYALLEVPNTGTSKGGNTILMYNTAVLEMVQCKSYYLSTTPYKPSENGWNSETQYRTTIWGEFKHKEANRNFFFADTHMPLNTGGVDKGTLARNNSAELNVNMMKAAAGEDATVFIVGDMNCADANSGLKNYYDWMSSAREKAVKTDNVKSFNNWGGSGQSILDHIFYRNCVPSEYRTVINNYGVQYISDHYPVLAKVTIL